MGGANISQQSAADVDSYNLKLRMARADRDHQDRIAERRALASCAENVGLALRRADHGS